MVDRDVGGPSGRHQFPERRAATTGEHIDADGPIRIWREIDVRIIEVSTQDWRTNFHRYRILLVDQQINADASREYQGRGFRESSHLMKGGYSSASSKPSSQNPVRRRPRCGTCRTRRTPLTGSPGTGCC